MKVNRPITCFTEWSLDQSLPHAKRYGRLALGFPKTFVFKRGGQPVTYVRDSQRHDPYVAALKAIAKLKTSLSELKLSTKDEERIRNHIDYLSHFVKRTKKLSQATDQAAAKRGSNAKLKASSGPTELGARTPKSPADLYRRNYGTILHYMEEREWRIVYDDSLKELFKDGPKPRQPSYFIPFEVGRELYTVVLPDNQTVNMAVNRKTLREKLYPYNAPHVTILSLQDIGTF